MTKVLKKCIAILSLASIGAPAVAVTCKDNLPNKITTLTQARNAFANRDFSKMLAQYPKRAKIEGPERADWQAQLSAEFPAQFTFCEVVGRKEISQKVIREVVYFEYSGGFVFLSTLAVQTRGKFHLFQLHLFNDPDEIADQF